MVRSTIMALTVRVSTSLVLRTRKGSSGMVRKNAFVVISRSRYVCVDLLLFKRRKHECRIVNVCGRCFRRCWLPQPSSGLQCGYCQTSCIVECYWFLLCERVGFCPLGPSLLSSFLAWFCATNRNASRIVSYRIVSYRIVSYRILVSRSYLKSPALSR